MIRKASIQDVKVIHGLLQEYGKKEELLARPLSELYDHIRDFSVYVDESNNQLIGCCALQFCWEDLAEIRSLAVLPEHIGKNIGTKLAETVLQEAKSFDVKKSVHPHLQTGLFQTIRIYSNRALRSPAENLGGLHHLY